MPVKDIVKIWDDEKLLEENVKFLRQPTKKVILPASDKTKLIIQDLIDSYKKITCAGIAANQIGYNKSIFIGMKKDEDVNTASIEEAEAKLSKSEGNPHPDNYEIYINPQIDKVDKKLLQYDTEGCLSIPYLSIAIARYDKIKVRYYNEKGKAQKKTLSGYLAKLFQHELDHLNGKLMIESKKIIDWKLLVHEKDQLKYKQLIKQYVEIITPK